MPRSPANRAAFSMVPSPPNTSNTSALPASCVFWNPPCSPSKLVEVVSKRTSMLRERSQLTTAWTVVLISGNFGLVRIPMLLLFIMGATVGESKMTAG